METVIRNLQRKVRFDKAHLLQVLERLGKLLGLDRAELSILFVNDKQIQELNRQYRSIDMPTDVLSFPMYDSEKEFLTAQRHAAKLMPNEYIPLGDIVINLHLLDRRAREAGHDLGDELLPVLIHGLLHLLGYDHEKNRYQAEKMRKKEKELINALKKMG